MLDRHVDVLYGTVAKIVDSSVVTNLMAGLGANKHR